MFDSVLNTRLLLIKFKYVIAARDIQEREGDYSEALYFMNACFAKADVDIPDFKFTHVNIWLTLNFTKSAYYLRLRKKYIVFFFYLFDMKNLS